LHAWGITVELGGGGGRGCDSFPYFLLNFLENLIFLRDMVVPLQMSITRLKGELVFAIVRSVKIKLISADHELSEQSGGIYST
jgi:hypothetical protein